MLKIDEKKQLSYVAYDPLHTGSLTLEEVASLFNSTPSMGKAPHKLYKKALRQLFNLMHNESTKPKPDLSVQAERDELREALKCARRQITIARCTLERKIQASDYVRSSHESDPAQYALAGRICEDINEFIHLAHQWVEKAETALIAALAKGSKP